MSKTVKLKSSDVYDVDDDLDFGNFDFESGSEEDFMSDSRKPVTKLRDGFVDGLKDTVTSPSFIKKQLKQTLPSGYGTAMDMADQGIAGISQLYDSAGKELKPVIKDLKRVTGKMLPMFDGMLPNAWSNKLKEWSREEKSFQQEQIDQKEAAINSSIGQIFGKMEEANQQRDAEGKATEALKGEVEKKRFESNFGQLNEMRLGITTLAQYKKNVESQYQRKSLELQFRSYYALADILTEMKDLNGNSKEKLSGILRNTGLPEFMKLQNTEYAKEIMRNEFIGGIHDGIFGGRRNFIQNMSQGLVKKGVEGIKDFKNSFVNGLSAVEMSADQIQMMKESGMMDPSVMAGEMAGAGAMEKFGDWTSKKLKGVIGKNEKVKKLGDRLAYEAGGATATAKDWADGYSHEDGWKGWITRPLKEVIRNQFGREKSAQVTQGEALNEAGMFTRRTDKSINEVIPGFLARILQEQTRTRLGTDDVELVMYDYNSSKFSTHKGISRAIGKMFDKKYMHDNINRDVKGMLDLIDPTGEKLSPEQRKVFGEAMLKSNIAGNKLTKEMMTETWNYRGGKAGDSDHISNVMGEYLGEGNNYGKLNQLQDRYNQVGTGNRIDYKKIQELIHLGYGDQLMEMGIIDERGRIRERDMLMDAFKTGDKNTSFSPYNDDEPITAKGTARRSKRVLGNQATSTAQAPRSPRSSGLQLDAEAFTPTNSILERIAASQAEMVTKTKTGSGTSDNTEYQTNVKSSLEKITEVLMGIHEQLIAGVRFAGMGDGELSSGNGSSWYNKTIGQLFKGTLAKVKGWKDKGFEKLGAGKDWLMEKGTMGKDWFSGKLPGWKDKATGMFGKAKDKFDNIYVEAEGKVRLVLDKVKLLKGDYWDVNTNTKITKFSDITGAVEDRSKDPAEIVLTEEQAKQAFVMVGKGKQLLSKLTKFKDWALDKLSFGSRKGSAILRLGRMLAKKAWRKFSDEPMDIFSPDNLETPLLYASLMRSGAYITKYRGHIVDRPSKIDGPILNRFKDNEEVVNEEQFRQGLVDINGKPVKTGIAKLFQKGKDLLASGMDRAKKLFGTLKSATGKMFGKGWDKFSNWAKDSGVLNPGSVVVVNRLDKIIDILDKRLPGGKKRKVGDVNGDGIVENSFEDIVAKRKEAAKEKLAELRDKGKAGLDGLKGSGLLASIMGLFGKKGVKKDGEEEGGEDDPSLLEQAGDAADVLDTAKDAGGWAKDKLRNGKRRLGRMFGRKAAGKAATEVAKKGLMQRGAGMAGRGLVAGGRGVGMAAQAGGRVLGGTLGMVGRGALGLMGSGAMSSMIGGAGSLLASGAATAGTLASGALGGIGAMAGGIASGLGALMSAPVLLGALAVGVAGYAAYKGYKYLTRNKMSSLEELRYAQYGFDPSDNQYWNKMVQLEEEVFKHVRFDDTTPSIDEKDMKVKAIAEDFGVNLEDQKQVANFIQWYRLRFKPVFMQHLSAWKRSGTKEDFQKLSSMTAPEKLKFLSFAKFPSGPYDVTLSPFPELAQLTAGKAVVDAAIKKAQDEIDKESKDKKPDVAKVGTAAAAGGTAAALAAKGLKTQSTATTPELKQVKTLADQLEQQQGKGVGDYSKINDQGIKTLGGTMAITGSYIPMAGTANGKVDALSAVRFKAYGLKELEVAKIRALSTLENGMLGKFRYNAKKVAEWTGSTQEMVNRFAPAFGIDVMDPIESGLWARWFAGRFLPVYLNFATSIYSATGKTDPVLAMNNTTGSQNYDVAMAIVGSNNRDGAPIWSVTFTPWRNYPLNTKSSSVDENIAALKAAQGDKIANDEKAKVDEKDKQQSSTAKAAGAAGEGKEESFLDTLQTKASSMWDGFKKTGVGQAMGAAADMIENSAVVQGAKQVGGAVADAAGKAVEWMTGSGGTYDSIVKPQGDGKMAVYKQMIEQVSKIVGVDPKLMLTMAAIESNFRGRVKADTSSATGLYQFIRGTWNDMTRRYGAKYGLPTNAQPTDPVANALMGAEFIKENAKALKSVRPQLTDTDLYLAHFLGPGGAKKLLSMAPGEDAVRAMPKPAAANKSIFFENGGNGRSRSASEVYAEVNRRVRTRAVQVGLEGKGSNMTPSAPTSPVVATAAPAVAPIPTKAAAAGAPATAPVAGATPKTTPPAATPAPKAVLAASSKTTPAPTAAAATEAVPSKATPVKVVAPAAAAVPVVATPRSTATQNAGLDMGTTNDVLNKSFQTQLGMLGMLQEILQVLSTPPKADGSTQVNRSATASAPRHPSKPAPLGKIPVDPTRTNYG